MHFLTDFEYVSQLGIKLVIIIVYLCVILVGACKLTFAQIFKGPNSTSFTVCGFVAAIGLVTWVHHVEYINQLEYKRFVAQCNDMGGQIIHEECFDEKQYQNAIIIRR